MLPSTATAATFTQTPPAQNTSGAGPFDFFARPDQQGDTVAYKLPTEDIWHRCQTNGGFSMSNLPNGTYTVQITDDIGYTPGSGSSGAYCHEQTDPPSAYWPRTTFTFTIGPAPPPAPTTRDYCGYDRVQLAKAGRRYQRAKAAYRQHHTRARRRARAAALRSVRRWQALVATNCP